MFQWKEGKMWLYESNQGNNKWKMEIDCNGVYTIKNKHILLIFCLFQNSNFLFCYIFEYSCILAIKLRNLNLILCFCVAWIQCSSLNKPNINHKDNRQWNLTDKIE